MDSTNENAHNDALAFLKNHKVGVLATSTGEHKLHASSVYYTSDDDFNVYFLTYANTRKFEAIQAHPQVAFTVSVLDVPQTLQIEGMAMDISLDDDASKKKEELIKVLNSNPWFYGPITKLDAADVVVVWIRPTWVRWADYAFADKGTENVLKEIQII